MPTLSYEVTLPQNMYSALDRLFSVFRELTNSFIRQLWNSQVINLLSKKTFLKTISYLAEEIEKIVVED